MADHDYGFANETCIWCGMQRAKVGSTAECPKHPRTASQRAIPSSMFKDPAQLDEILKRSREVHEEIMTAEKQP